MDKFVAKYECHLYDKGGKNDWHYVDITKVDSRTLLWKNKAGVSWTLTFTDKLGVFDVGPTCPYRNEKFKHY